MGHGDGQGIRGIRSGRPRKPKKNAHHLSNLRLVCPPGPRDGSLHAGRRVLGDREARSGTHEECHPPGMSEFCRRLGIFREKEGFDARRGGRMLRHNGCEALLDCDQPASEFTFLFDIEHSMGHVA